MERGRLCGRGDPFVGFKDSFRSILSLEQLPRHALATFDFPSSLDRPRCRAVHDAFAMGPDGTRCVPFGGPLPGDDGRWGPYLSTCQQQLSKCVARRFI